MRKDLYIGQCFKVAPYGQAHYYKILCTDNGHASLVAYVSIYGSSIYAGKSTTISIDENAVEIAETEFDSIYQKVTTKLLPIVDFYTSFPFRIIDDTTQYIDNVPFHPKGQCFVKAEDGGICFCKLKNPFEYHQVTVEEIYLCSKPDCIGISIAPYTKIDSTKGYKEIDRKDFTQLKRYTTNFTRPAMLAIVKEFL